MQMTLATKPAESETLLLCDKWADSAGPAKCGRPLGKRQSGERSPSTIFGLPSQRRAAIAGQWAVTAYGERGGNSERALRRATWPFMHAESVGEGRSARWFNNRGFAPSAEHSAPVLPPSLTQPENSATGSSSVQHADQTNLR